MQLVLASTSPYRKQLLSSLGIPFTTASPNVDETPTADERPAALARRLAVAKANAVAAQFSDALIIGSDQTAALDGQFLGKPQTVDRAVAQLRLLRGRRVCFFTGLCLLNVRTGRQHLAVESYTVTLRELSDAEIDDYVARDNPLDCAGAFRSEGLGIALFERLEGDDPNTLVGLPLIRLVGFLQDSGVHVLGAGG